MSFKEPTPIPPGPKAKHSATREASSITALGEVKRVLSRLINLLAPYSPQQFIDLNGHRMEVLARDMGRGSVSTAGSHPFQVLVRNNGTALSPVWQAMVISSSYLYQSFRPNHKYTITNLNTWFTLTSSDAIWIGIVFNSSGVPTSAAIDSYGQSDSFDLTAEAWAGSNGYCEDNGSDPRFHQTSRKLIAYTEADGSGNPVLTQVMFHDQLLRNVCVDSRPARYPFDHDGGYPL